MLQNIMLNLPCIMNGKIQVEVKVTNPVTMIFRSFSFNISITKCTVSKSNCSWLDKSRDTIGFYTAGLPQIVDFVNNLERASKKP